MRELMTRFFIEDLLRSIEVFVDWRNIRWMEEFFGFVQSKEVFVLFKHHNMRRLVFLKYAQHRPESPQYDHGQKDPRNNTHGKKLPVSHISPLAVSGYLQSEW
jgi:hypothetical protein